MEQNKETTAVEVVKKDVTAKVLQKVDLFKKSGELRIPDGYCPENALKSAYLVLREAKTACSKPVLEHCTQESIADSLLKMIVWGLSPLKKQCYFIAYGNKLQCDPDYSGNILLAKRYGGLSEINGHAIFQGDDFAFGNDAETGRKKIIKHEQKLDDFGKDVIGAYAVYTFQDGTTKAEIMNINQIKNAWGMGGTKGSSPAHNKFSDQMAIKTVINRACKLIIRSSDDAVLYSDSKDPIDTEYIDVTEAVHQEIEEKANTKTIGLEEVKETEAATVETVQETPSETTEQPSEVKTDGKPKLNF